MKIINLLLVAFLFVACTKDNEVRENVLEKPYEQIQKEARGSEVSIYMWGGSKEVNNYFDEFVIPNVKKLYDIKLNRVPIDDVKSVLQKIELEKNSNKKGSIDIIWINGENFKIAKTKDLLYGSFVSKLPNYNVYVDSKNKSNLLDFSEPTNLLEAPFGRAQFVMVYDSNKVQNPPKNPKELFRWIKNNPRRFSYPAIPDFTGSAFVRQLFLSSIGGIENFDKDNYKSDLKILFKQLNDIKPYMFKNGSYLPKSSALLDTLYANGSVDFTFSYNPSHALNKIKTSNFPKSSKTAIFEGGTLANTHFLTISKTASNPKAAIVVINFLLSPTAQYQKAQSSVWGDGTVLDLNKLDDDFKVKFSNLTSNSALLDSKILQENQIPELSADYIEEIEKIWKQDVLQK